MRGWSEQVARFSKSPERRELYRRPELAAFPCRLIMIYGRLNVSERVPLSINCSPIRGKIPDSPFNLSVIRYACKKTRVEEGRYISRLPPRREERKLEKSRRSSFDVKIFRRGNLVVESRSVGEDISKADNGSDKIRRDRD